MTGELSIFVDESGDRGGKSRYYLITLVFYTQADDVTDQVADYERRLAECRLPDYLCTIELAAVKYDAHEDGETYNKFFGTPRDFKKNWLKQARRKRI